LCLYSILNPQKWVTQMKDDLSQSDIAGACGSLTRYAIQVFECEKIALDWLESSVIALGCQRPCDLWQTRDGREQIAQVLRKIELGDFS